MRWIVLVGMAVLLLCAYVVGWPAPYRSGSVPGLYGYSRMEVEKRVSTANVGVSFDHVRRNSAGTAMYITGVDGKQTAMLGPSGNKLLKKPAGIAFATDDGDWCAWSESDSGAMKLARGDSKTGPEFDVDPSGRYYFSRAKPGAQLELGECRAARAQSVPVDLFAERLFAQGDHLYVVGHKQIVADEFQILCAVFRDSGTSFVFEKLVPLARLRQPFAIVDMDPSSGRVLLEETRDLPFQSKWLLSDFQGSHKRLGGAKDFGLFLKADVLKSAS